MQERIPLTGPDQLSLTGLDVQPIGLTVSAGAVLGFDDVPHQAMATLTPPRKHNAKTRLVPASDPPRLLYSEFDEHMPGNPLDPRSKGRIYTWKVINRLQPTRRDGTTAGPALEMHELVSIRKA